MLSVERLRSDVAELSRLAGRDIAGLLRDASDLVDADRILKETLDELVSIYGAAARTLAADWFDEAREAARIPGRHRPVMPDLPDRGRTASLAEWATGMDEFDLAALVTRVTGGTQRIIADASRNTITRSIISDPRGRGWQRTGAGECGFCRMLIDRGAVYTRDTVDFGSHDHCKCAAVPVWGGQELPVKPHRGSERRISEADRRRTQAWMAKHGYLAD